jgi:hypothetical protein
MKKLFAVPFVAALLLVGCSKAKDVAYYKDNAAERGKKVSDCDTYHDDSADCKAAREAMQAVYAVKEPAPEGNESVAAAVK